MQATDEEVENIFRLAIDGNQVTRADADRNKTKCLSFWEECKEAGQCGFMWADSSNNSRMYSVLGPDTGLMLLTAIRPNHWQP